MGTVAQDVITTLTCERNAAQARTRELEEALQAAREVLMCVCDDANERHSAACATIQRLSEECERLTNDNDRWQELIRDFIRHNDRYPDLYHPARSWAWVEQGNKLREQAHE